MIQVGDLLVLETGSVYKHPYAFIFPIFLKVIKRDSRQHLDFLKLCDQAHMKYRLQEAKELQHAVYSTPDSDQYIRLSNALTVLKAFSHLKYVRQGSEHTPAGGGNEGAR